MENKRGSGRVLITGLVIAAAAGGIAAVLLAPKAGKETRDFLRVKGGELFSKLRFRARNINTDQAPHLSRTTSD